MSSEILICEMYGVMFGTNVSEIQKNEKGEEYIECPLCGNDHLIDKENEERIFEAAFGKESIAQLYK